jgi:hypothetical protein
MLTETSASIFGVGLKTIFVFAATAQPFSTARGMLFGSPWAAASSICRLVSAIGS